MKKLLEETLALRARYDEEPSHSDHVADLALQIFDALRFPLKLDDRAREILQSAALLHDIGWSQTPDGRGHHKESARLIGEHKWEALLAAEIPLVAQVARYHRKSLPRPEHEAYEKLPLGERKLVLLLGGILRLGRWSGSHAYRAGGAGDGGGRGRGRDYSRAAEGKLGSGAGDVRREKGDAGAGTEKADDVRGGLVEQRVLRPPRHLKTGSFKPSLSEDYA